MEINWSIVGWIAAIIFVYLFGLFEGRSQGYKRRKGEETQEKPDQPAPKPTTVKVDDPGLMRIKNENGSMTLDLDGARVDTSSLLPDQRKRLIEMLSFIRPWLEGKPAAPASSTSIESRLDAVSASRPQSGPAPVISSSQAALQPAAQKDDKPKAPPASMSMVAQINEILQTRIVNTKFAEQGITLMELPSSGVNVYVGLNRYDGIDAVPDEEIKAVIRAAIAEWENKYTPGLK